MISIHTSSAHPSAAPVGPVERSGQVGSGGRSRRRRPLGVLGALFALAILAAGCSTGPGTEAEFVDVLTRDGLFTDEQASCISDAVFDEYEADQEALKRISAAPDYEFLNSDEGVPGFTEFFEREVVRCAPFGP
jgi:hypothetical protein